MVIFVCQSIQFFISLRNQIIGTLGTCIWNTNMQLSLWIGYIFFIVDLFIGFYRLNVNYQLTSSMLKAQKSKHLEIFSPMKENLVNISGAE